MWKKLKNSWPGREEQITLVSDAVSGRPMVTMNKEDAYIILGALIIADLVGFGLLIGFGIASGFGQYV